jgi:hypothetical protein
MVPVDSNQADGGTLTRRQPNPHNPKERSSRYEKNPIYLGYVGRGPISCG